MSLASVDGTIGPIEQAVIPATDEGLLRGDGIFEGMRLYGGRPAALGDPPARPPPPAPLPRGHRPAHTLRLPVDVDALGPAVTPLLDAAGPVDALLRIVVARGAR